LADEALLYRWSRRPNTQRWLDYFVKRGHEVHLIITKKAQEDLEGVITHEATPYTKIKKLGFLTRVWKIKRIIKKIKPTCFMLTMLFTMVYSVLYQGSNLLC